MKFTPLALNGLLLIEPNLFEDERGWFFESFNQELFKEATGLSINFVQDNHSRSVKHVLRGLHYQAAPKGQGKLVRVIEGEILDVAVDIRPDSSTFGQHLTAVLSAENKKQMWIPEGFAHGFLTLSDTSQMLYKTTELYDKAHDRCILWNDAELAIDWPLTGPVIMSEKDKNAPGIRASLFSPHK
jgi:dTDP-4-dehydrorhamnose 3,5-epimerase